MRQNNHIYLIAILLLTLSGCKDQNRQQNSQAIIISADLDKMDEISIHDIFDRVEMIPLETTDESLIRESDKVVCYNDRYYVFDFIGKKIFVFDDKGSFLWKIDDLGQGPEQYIWMADFDINRWKNTLVFVDAIAATLHEYSLDGRFLHKQKMPGVLYNCTKMKFLNSDTIAFWTYDYDNRLKLYSTSGNQVLKEYIPERDNDFNSANDAFYSCDRNFFMKTGYNDICEIMPNGDISIAYAWDFGKLNIDADKLEKTKIDSEGTQIKIYNRMRESESINYLFIALGSNSDYLYTQVIRKNKCINVLYNKKKQNVSVFEKTKESVHFYPIYWADDFVISCTPGHLPLFKKDLEKIIPDAILDAESIEKKRRRDEFDNPFLVKYYFKK